MKDLGASFNIKDAHLSSNLAKLVENEDFMLTFNILSLAKNFNYLGTVDSYMKEFSGIVVQSLNDRGIQKRLEEVLTREIGIINKSTSSVVE